MNFPTQATVEAFVTSCPSPGQHRRPTRVEVAFEVLAPKTGSAEVGGHAHNMRRRHGTLKQRRCTAELDADGQGSCTVTYQPSEVSGVETIVAEAQGFPKARAAVTVQVPGLVELPDDPPRYLRVGTPDSHEGTNDPCRRTAPTSKHFQNHFGQPHLNAAVGAVADTMLEQTSILLRVNDMSLPWGGLLDIRNNWNQPHKGHRVGLEVDIGFSGVRDGACAAYDRRQLQRVILQATKNDPVEEGDHFHAFVR